MMLRAVSLAGIVLALFAVPGGKTQERKITTASVGENPHGESGPLNWEAPARLRHGLGSISGTLRLDTEEVVFRSPKGLLRRWPIAEIQTLDLWPRQLDLTGYEKRGRFRPGVQRFRFHLDKEIPPAVASGLARVVGKPVRNGVPEPKAPAFETMLVRHRTAFGGTASNGTLRFMDGGIEYITSAHRDSRSWSWSDIQTLSNPNTYRLMVFGYRETYSFDLKQPLTRELFNRLSDLLYARNVNDSTPYEGRKP